MSPNSEWLLNAIVAGCLAMFLTTRVAEAQDVSHLRQMIDVVAPSIVSITVEALEPSQAPTRQGAGIVVGAEGHVVTTSQLLEGASNVTVTLSDGSKLPAQVVAADRPTSIALLKATPASPLTPIRFGNSDQLRAGQPVLIMGDPLAPQGGVAHGVIASLDFDLGFGPYENPLKIDATLRTRHAGGALLNHSGEAVGMVNVLPIGIPGQVFGPDSPATGLAQPSNLLQDVVGQLRDSGTVERGWLGVKIQNLTNEEAAARGLPKATGALITGLVDGGPAATGGLQTGDVVLSVNGLEVNNTRILSRTITELPPGSEAILGVVRAGGKLDVRVRIGRLPPPDPPAPAPEARSPLEFPELGISVAPPGGAEKGLVIARVAEGSPAADRQLRPGDVIVELNQVAVTTPDAVRDQLAAAFVAGKRSVLLLCYRAGEPRFVALPIIP
jgi:serine protease Do